MSTFSEKRFINSEEEEKTTCYSDDNRGIAEPLELIKWFWDDLEVKCSQHENE